jgi:hypothetical protein
MEHAALSNRKVLQLFVPYVSFCLRELLEKAAISF